MVFLFQPILRRFYLVLFFSSFLFQGISQGLNEMDKFPLSFTDFYFVFLKVSVPTFHSLSVAFTGF